MYSEIEKAWTDGKSASPPEEFLRLLPANAEALAADGLLALEWTRSGRLTGAAWVDGDRCFVLEPSGAMHQPWFQREVSGAAVRVIRRRETSSPTAA